MDEKVLRKRRLEEEQEINWQKEKLNASQKKDERDKQNKLNDQVQKEKSKALCKQREKLKAKTAKTNNLEKSNHQNEYENYKSLPKSFQQILSNKYELEKIPGNGACACGCFAKHALGDASLGPKIGEELNKEIAQNFWYYRQLLESRRIKLKKTLTTVVRDWESKIQRAKSLLCMK